MDIIQYSVRQTSLEQIFNGFANNALEIQSEGNKTTNSGSNRKSENLSPIIEEHKINNIEKDIPMKQFISQENSSLKNQEVKLTVIQQKQNSTKDDKEQ